MNQKEASQSIGSVLKALVQSLGIEQRVEQYAIFDLWTQVVGEQVAKVTAPQRIHNGTLVVAVTNAPWRNELTFRKKEILEKIHQVMQTNSITDIMFR